MDIIESAHGTLIIILDWEGRQSTQQQVLANCLGECVSVRNFCSLLAFIHYYEGLACKTRGGKIRSPVPFIVPSSEARDLLRNLSL